MSDQHRITRLLLDLSRGDDRALDSLTPLVYQELQRLAHHHLRGERQGHTLNTTALVHEAYIKLVDQTQVQWQDRTHFFAVASMAMRRILVNYAKGRKRAKRGGGATVLSLDDGVDVMSEERSEEIIALDAALERLLEISSRAGRVVECRFFGGLSIEETGTALGVAPMTVKRDWRFAKTWLLREISGDS